MVHLFKNALNVRFGWLVEDFVSSIRAAVAASCCKSSRSSSEGSAGVARCE